jgi:hypothetical protein
LLLAAAGSAGLLQAAKRMATKARRRLRSAIFITMM